MLSRRQGPHRGRRGFFYSLKRMADSGNSPKGWWLLQGSIVGFDEYREEQNRLVDESRQAITAAKKMARNPQSFINSTTTLRSKAWSRSTTSNLRFC